MKLQGTGKNQYSFAKVPDVRIERSRFDRSHGHKTTFDAGYLIPVYIDEALPGDTFNLNMTAFARLATPIKPIMDNIYMESFFFAVPYRLLWKNWERFNGAQDDPDDSTDFTLPYMRSDGITGFVEGSIEDYFGLPLGVVNLEVSLMHHRAYNLIYNEWFRDENLIDSAFVSKEDELGGYLQSSYPLQRRGKRHDYFTSCLPWTQKGDPVQMSLVGTIPVQGNGQYPYFHNTNGENAYLTSVDATNSIGTSITWVNSNPLMFGTAANAQATGLEAEVTDELAFTINALREAFQVQKLLERDARGGTRYTEILRSHFGVTSPDFRLQRPEYLGGGTSAVMVAPIAQNSATGATGTPQGNLAGVGMSTMRVGFNKSFTEHCVIIGLVSARADMTYQQGLHRMFSRRTRYDFYWPSFSHLGEQAVLNKEIFCDNSPADDEVFGYQERYAEMRYYPSKVTSKFRSSATGSLDVWHLAQDFAALPELGQAFIEENPPMTRILAVPTEPHFLFDSYFDLKCVRPMPVYSVPGLMDHF